MRRMVSTFLVFVVFVIIPLGCARTSGSSREAMVRVSRVAPVVRPQTDRSWKAPVPVEREDPPSIAGGRLRFQRYCSPCHGSSGRGDGIYFGSNLEAQPANLADPSYHARTPDERILKAIGEGTAALGKSNLCPPWKYTLDHDEMVGVLKFVKTLASAQAQREGAAADSPSGADSR